MCKFSSLREIYLDSMTTAWFDIAGNRSNFAVLVARDFGIRTRKPWKKPERLGHVVRLAIAECHE